MRHCNFTGLAFSLALSLASSLPALAAESKRPPHQAPEPRSAVHVLDPAMDASGLDPKRYQVVDPANEPRELPNPNQRDLLLVQAGFSAGDLKDFDELERDMLLLRAKHRDLDDLAAAYPSLPREHLEALRRLVR